MNKVDYYVLCMRTETYKLRDWVISAFCVVDPRPHITEVSYPYQLIYDPADPEALFFASPLENGQYESVKIEGSSATRALYHAKESLDLPANVLPLEHDAMNTTYGIILGNMYLLHYPFRNKFKFHNGVITKKFEDQLIDRFTDNVKPGEEEDPNKIYVREYALYGEAMGAIAGFDKIFASSGSVKALTVDPKVIALRDELIKKHKHELNDIRVQAMIEEAVVAADKASFKGDPAEDFLITGKSFNPTRKKQLIMIGGSAGFGEEGAGGNFIAKSLRDGWDVDDIPIHANEARSGSYNRGKDTALGGTEVKNGTRMAMNTKISEDFCGTKRGMPVTIAEYDKSMYYGLYVVGKDQPIVISKENVSEYIGKPIMVHSPIYCLSEGDAFCKTCIGDGWSKLPHGMSNVVTNIGDVLMYDRMKRMHGKALSTGEFFFMEHIS